MILVGNSCRIVQEFISLISKISEIQESSRNLSAYDCLYSIFVWPQLSSFINTLRFAVGRGKEAGLNSLPHKKNNAKILLLYFLKIK